MFSFPVEGGIYSKSGAAQINPYRFTQELINYSVDRGLTVYENTYIANIYPKKDYVLLETNNNFKIKAKKAIIATGYESIKYFKEKIVHLSRTFTIVTKPVQKFTGWHKACIIRDNKDPYTYLRTTGDNRIIIGGEDEDIGNIDSKMSNLTNEDEASKIKYDILLERLISYFPDINNIEAEFKFSGIFGVTGDGLPYIGEYSKMPNCYFSLGYGSNGIIYAVLGAQLLKDLYVGERKPELKLF